MVNLGVIGVKGIGKNHIKSIQRVEEADLVAVADIDESAGRATAEECGVKWYADYEEMLRRDDLEAVCVCTPHYLHAPMALRAIEHGKHVMVEKPMAITVGEADQMVEKAKKAGVKLAVMHQYRTRPEFAEAKAILERGDLGPLYRVSMEACVIRTWSYYEGGPWRTTWRQSGGGALINQTIHHFDLLRWFVGRPTKLQGWIDTRLHRTQVEDIASAVILFEGGVHGVAQVSIIDAPSTVRFEVCGDRGKLVQEEKAIRLGILDTPIREFIEKSGKRGGGGPRCTWRDVTPEKRETDHHVLIRDFARAILEDREPMVPGEEGRASLEIVNAIILSSFRDRPVTFPVDRAEYAKLMAKLQTT